MPDGGPPEDDWEDEGEEEEEVLPVTEAVRSVRSSEEPYNWVLIKSRK